jgi:lipoprotein-anchoring transpeptidase ErfK/SrfK
MSCGVKNNMRLLSSLLTLFLLCCIVSSEDLDARFDAAENANDLVPLIESVSALLPTLPADQARILTDRVAPYCQRLFWSPSTAMGRERCGLISHIVAAGDTPIAIAKKYHTTVEMIARLNEKFAPTRLSIGQTLTVLDLASQPLELAVSRSSFRLMAWRGPLLVGSFHCGLGRVQSPTPLGTSSITQCVRNPEWRDPDSGKIFKPNDPGNVLGGYWIGFDHGADLRFKGIGIHGFTAQSPDEWLGKNGSHGCVRLVQEDIAMIFALVRPGNKVTVRE